MQSEPSEVNDPERIYLQPDCCTDYLGEGRHWCADNVWPTSPDCDKSGVEYIRADLLTRTDSPTDAVVQKMVRVINGNLTTGISMGQAERYADEDTALAVLAALTPSGEVERLREVARIADELINGGGLRNNGECLMVVEKRDKSDPHYRLCDALVALRNSTDGETM